MGNGEAHMEQRDAAQYMQKIECNLFSVDKESTFAALLREGWKERKEQPDAMQTGAGLMTVKVLEKTQPYWSVKEVEYLVYIKPQGQSNEYTGHVNLHYMMANDQMPLSPTESSQFISENMEREFRLHMIPLDAKIVQIRKFYPIGTVAKYQRKGIGNAMLDILESDASKEGASAIFCYTVHTDTLGKRLADRRYSEFREEVLYLKILAR
jgi:ribosomal protein S18 acetylase RimI-like enzyme